MVVIVCPFCGHEGKVNSDVDAGRRIRCQKCRATFPYEPPTFVKAEDPIVGDVSEAIAKKAPKQPRTIEQRMARLERTNRALIVGLILLGLAFLLRTRPMDINQIETELRSKSIVGQKLIAPEIFANALHIMGPGNTPVVTLDTIGGHGRIKVGNPDNGCKVEVRPNAVDMADGDGRQRITLHTNAILSGASISIRDFAGNAALTTGADAGSWLYLMDSQGKSRLKLDVANNHPRIQCTPVLDKEAHDLIP